MQLRQSRIYLYDINVVKMENKTHTHSCRVGDSFPALGEPTANGERNSRTVGHNKRRWIYHGVENYAEHDVKRIAPQGTQRQKPPVLPGLPKRRNTGHAAWSFSRLGFCGFGFGIGNATSWKQENKCPRFVRDQTDYWTNGKRTTLWNTLPLKSSKRGWTCSRYLAGYRSNSNWPLYCSDQKRVLVKYSFRLLLGILLWSGITFTAPTNMLQKRSVKGTDDE